MLFKKKLLTSSALIHSSMIGMVERKPATTPVKLLNKKQFIGSISAITILSGICLQPSIAFAQATGGAGGAEGSVSEAKNE